MDKNYPETTEGCGTEVQPGTSTFLSALDAAVGRLPVD